MSPYISDEGEASKFEDLHRQVNGGTGDFQVRKWPSEMVDDQHGR